MNFQQLIVMLHVLRSYRQLVIFQRVKQKIIIEHHLLLHYDEKSKIQLSEIGPGRFGGVTRFLVFSH